MSTRAESFDVFLSHKGTDKPIVERLVEELRKLKIRVWYDEDELPPGIPWQPLLESGIRNSKAIAVVIASGGLGQWENEEMQAALNLAVKDGRPVIAVMLPGAPASPELPMFLENRTWVDLRAGLTPEGLDRLAWGITGVKKKQTSTDATESATGSVPPNPKADLVFWQEQVKFCEEQAEAATNDSQLSALNVKAKFARKKIRRIERQYFIHLAGLGGLTLIRYWYIWTVLVAATLYWITRPPVATQLDLRVFFGDIEAKVPNGEKTPNSDDVNWKDFQSYYKTKGPFSFCGDVVGTSPKTPSASDLNQSRTVLIQVRGDSFFKKYLIRATMSESMFQQALSDQSLDITALNQSSEGAVKSVRSRVSGTFTAFEQLGFDDLEVPNVYLKVYVDAVSIEFGESCG